MDFETRQGNITTRYGARGPIAHLIGFILSSLVVLVVIIVGGILVVGHFNESKFKNYITVDAKVLEKVDEANYKVSYMIEDKVYESEVFVVSDYENGSYFEILVNPDDLNNVYYKGESDETGTLIFTGVLIFALFVGIASAKTHLNNFLHYLNPSKYSYKESKSDIDDNEDYINQRGMYGNEGDYKRLRF